MAAAAAANVCSLSPRRASMRAATLHCGHCCTHVGVLCPQEEAKALVESGVVELNLIAEDTNQVCVFVCAAAVTDARRCWQLSRDVAAVAGRSRFPDGAWTSLRLSIHSLPAVLCVCSCAAWCVQYGMDR